MLAAIRERVLFNGFHFDRTEPERKLGFQFAGIVVEIVHGLVVIRHLSHYSAAARQ